MLVIVPRPGMLAEVTVYEQNQVRWAIRTLKQALQKCSATSG